ncbi:papain-like cysteine protease family protein [uncultured Vibrio sp.]|uniref:papain-like cysteine protease family protein n=1 Tax=uncultured Vibrio sp. TaxID=114054 RepID=UPI0025E5484E|nr:papain-like cysteine protease family protein [uncultured Vibrio sp.]
MNRREFLKLSAVTAGVGSLAVSSSAHALLQCTPFDMSNRQRCQAGIASNLAYAAAESAEPQQMTQWCWAACISMVFSYYGHPVSQSRIVENTWGGLVNNPGQPWQILNNLNKPWTDENGTEFMVQGDTYTANHVSAAQDLANNRPLIVGTMGHAMVLTAVEYERTNFGQGLIRNATVRDPWQNRGMRYLTPQEWYNMNFLARIYI